MTDPNKKEEKPVDPNAGNPQPQPPPQEDWKAKWEESEKLRKDQDSKINDLQTTLQTIQTRFDTNKNQPNHQDPSNQGDDEDAEFVEIIETAQFDKDSAKRRLAQLRAKQKAQIAQEAVKLATGQITAQTTLEKLKAGVKSSHPEFDDEVVDVVMGRANEIAASGKFKTAEEAVNEAAKYIKSKFDSYASKVKAVPPLPPGAGAEGGSNPAPSAPVTEKVEEPSDFVESMITAKSKKIL